MALMNGYWILISYPSQNKFLKVKTFVVIIHIISIFLFIHLNTETLILSNFTTFAKLTAEIWYMSPGGLFVLEQGTKWLQKNPFCYDKYTIWSRIELANMDHT